MSNYFLISLNNERNIIVETVRFFESYRKSVFSFPFDIKEDDFYGPAVFNALKRTDKVIVVLSTQFSTDEKVMDALYLTVHLKKDIAIINAGGTKPVLELKRYLKSRPVFNTLAEFGQAEGFLADNEPGIKAGSDPIAESNLPSNETPVISDAKEHQFALFDLRGVATYLINKANDIYKTSDGTPLVHGESACQGSGNISLSIDFYCGNMSVDVHLKNEAANKALMSIPANLEKTDDGYKLSDYYVNSEEFYGSDISLFENLLSAVGINDRNCWKLPAITLDYF